MKKVIICALTLLAVLIPAFNTRAEVAAGLMLGSPTGITIRIDEPLVFGIGSGFYSTDFLVMVDYYLIHKPIPSTSISLNWYLGIGGEFGAWDHHYHHDYHGWYDGYDGGVFLGARVPIGLLLPFEQRFEAFLEIAPVVMLLPGGMDGNGGIGIRYRF